MSADVMWMRARARTHTTKKKSLKADIFKTLKRKLITEFKCSWAHSSHSAAGSPRPGSATSHPHSAAQPKPPGHCGRQPPPQALGCGVGCRQGMKQSATQDSAPPPRGLRCQECPTNDPGRSADSRPIAQRFAGQFRGRLLRLQLGSKSFCRVDTTSPRNFYPLRT